MTRRLLLPALAVLVLAGCGTGNETGPAGPALEATAQKLEQIRSGVLKLSVRMEPRDGEEFGYEIEGPVRLGADGEAPAADVSYRQFVDGAEETARLVFREDGTGFVERDGERTDLTAEQVAALRESGSILGEDGLGSLDFQPWVRDPERSDGPDGTDKVTGELDVAAAMAGLSALSGVLKRDLVLEPEQRRQVQEAVEESSFELLTGKDDRLLRRLAVAFTLAADVPEDLRDALGQEAVGASFSFELELEDVNEPVEIGG